MIFLNENRTGGAEIFSGVSVLNNCLKMDQPGIDPFGRGNECGGEGAN